MLIALTGGLWRDEYEVCRDKRQKWSPNGRVWRNFSAWNPTWSAVCWYDVALIRREPPERRQTRMRSMLLALTALPEEHCQKLRGGWYPGWIDNPWPMDDLCCTHKILRPENGEVRTRARESPGLACACACAAAGRRRGEPGRP